MVYVTSTQPVSTPSDRAVVGDELNVRLESMIQMHEVRCAIARRERDEVLGGAAVMA